MGAAARSAPALFVMRDRFSGTKLADARAGGSGFTDVSQTTGDHSRYRDYPSHFLPRTASGKLAVGLYLAFLAFAEWPLLPLANRIEPTVLGFPFLFVYLAVIYTAKIATLLYAAKRL